VRYALYEAISYRISIPIHFSNKAVLCLAWASAVRPWPTKNTVMPSLLICVGQTSPSCWH
jgi:hypothetical protein